MLNWVITNVLCRYQPVCIARKRRLALRRHPDRAAIRIASPPKPRRRNPAAIRIASLPKPRLPFRRFRVQGMVDPEENILQVSPFNPRGKAGESQPDICPKQLQLHPGDRPDI